MRRAIISDIHGNLIALEAVLKDCADQRVDDIVCLGDMLGFGPDPVECVELVMDRCTWSLCGDHDIRIFYQVGDNWNQFARKCIVREQQIFGDWRKDSQKKKRWEWLKSLKPKRQEHEVLYVHGSPRDPLQEFMLLEDFIEFDGDRSLKAKEIFSCFVGLCFCGHSHRPGVITKKNRWLRPKELTKMAYSVDLHEQTIVNVGSVGQPRDLDPRGCYAIWDYESKTVTFRRVPYDLKAVRLRFQRVPELDERLYLRLEQGT